MFSKNILKYALNTLLAQYKASSRASFSRYVNKVNLSFQSVKEDKMRHMHTVMFENKNLDETANKEFIAHKNRA